MTFDQQATQVKALQVPPHLILSTDTALGIVSEYIISGLSRVSVPAVLDWEPEELLALALLLLMRARRGVIPVDC